LALWLAAESVLVAIGHPAPCWFRTITGFPCPTCGSTRAVVRLLHLDFGGALAYNPLVTAALLAAPLVGLLYLVRRAAGRRSPFAALSRRSGWVALVLVVLLLANWAYVLRAERARGEPGRNAGARAGKTLERVQFRRSTR
jgi:hypothetical protein